MATVDRGAGRDGSRTGAVAAACLVAVGVATWANSLHGVFVYDDLSSIRDNPYIESLWPLSDAMSLPLRGSGFTVDSRPVLSLSFALNRALLGSAPRGFHVGNLAIHLVAALLLFGCVRRTLIETFAREPSSAAAIAFATSLLWLVHPLQTESVTYLAQRAESQMGALYLATLYCAMRSLPVGSSRRSSRSRRGWVGLAVVASALGMGTKEVMVTAPLVVLLYDVVFVSGTPAAALRERAGLYAALAATWVLLAIPLSTQLANPDSVNNDFTARSAVAYALAQPGVILHYLRLAVWPQPLVIHYAWPPADGFAAIWAEVLALGALLAATLVGLWRRAWWGFAGAWFFAILLPTSSVLALAQRAQEHRVYLSLAAPCLLLVVCIDAGLRRVFGGQAAATVSRVAGAALLGVVALSLAVATHARNRDYADDYGFWSAAVDARPDSAVSRTNLGIALAARADFRTAEVHYRRAIELDPRDAKARFNLALLHQRRGDLHAAVAGYERAIAVSPRYARAHTNLGIALVALGEHRRAAAHFERALGASPRDAEAHNGLGIAWARQGEPDRAAAAFARAIQIRPDYAQAHFNLGLARESVRDLQGARAGYERALQLEPDYDAARRALSKLAGAGFETSFRPPGAS